MSATRREARTAASITVAHRGASRRPVLVETDELSREAGVHPELVRALVRLGLLEGVELLPDAAGWGRLLSVRAHGSHLFLRYAFSRSGEE